MAKGGTLFFITMLKENKIPRKPLQLVGDNRREIPFCGKER